MKDLLAQGQQGKQQRTAVFPKLTQGGKGVAATEQALQKRAGATFHPRTGCGLADNLPSLMAQAGAQTAGRIRFPSGERRRGAAGKRPQRQGQNQRQGKE